MFSVRDSGCYGDGRTCEVPAAPKPATSRATRWLATVVLALACHPRGLRDPYASNFDGIRVSGGVLIDASTRQPYSGTLIARDAEIGIVANVVLDGTPLEGVAKLDTTGLVLILPVVDGKPHGEAQLRADLQASRIAEEVVQRTSGLSLLVARGLSSTVQLGRAKFEHGELEGTAVLVVPTAGPTTDTLAEVPFHDNRVHGVAREYFAGTTQPKREVSFAHGVPSGAQRHFYASGKLEWEASSVEGELDGERVEFYEDGSRRALAIFERGEPVAPRREWYPTGQPLREIEVTADGVRTVEWYSNGAIKSRTEPGTEVVEFPPPDGEVIDYHDNGAIHRTTLYADGREHGSFSVHYSSGSQWEAGAFVDGKQHGPHRKWWNNGTLALEASFVAGELDGAYRRWYPDGRLWEEATYAAGKPTGRYHKWWKNGALAHDYQYVGGKLDGDYRTYYDDGSTWAIGQYTNGKPVDVHRRWFRDGRLGFIQHHENGRPHGAVRRWYADGTRRLEANYVAGRLEGELKNWLEDGTVYEIATYDRGKKIRTTLPPDPVRGPSPKP